MWIKLDKQSPIQGFRMPALLRAVPCVDAGVRKPPGKEPAGWRTRLLGLWGFDDFALRSLAAPMRVASESNGVDGRELAKAAAVAT